MKHTSSGWLELRFIPACLHSVSAKEEQWGMNEFSINSTANINRFDTMFHFDFNFHLSVLDIFKLLHK